MGPEKIIGLFFCIFALGGILGFLIGYAKGHIDGEAWQRGWEECKKRYG